MNMNLKWIIEEFDGDENAQKIADAVRNLGHDAQVVKYAIYQELDKLSSHNNNICVGTITFARNIERSSWNPGIICNFKNFDCMSYYGYFGKYLSNNDYLFFPLGEVERRLEAIKAMLGCNFLFIRPSNGLKTFGGHVIYDYKDLEYLTKKYPVHLPVVVSSKKSLIAEYRVFIHKDKILTGSKYKNGSNVEYKQMIEENKIYGLHDEEATQQKEVYNFVDTVLKETKFRPDPIFAMDIGIHPIIGPKLLELSSFSTSGWYESDINKLVAAGSDCAIEAIQEVM